MPNIYYHRNFDEILSLVNRAQEIVASNEPLSDKSAATILSEAKVEIDKLIVVLSK